MNLYIYVGNNPINLVDPMGLCGKRLRGIARNAWEGRYVGTQHGERALDYYAHKIAFGGPSYKNIHNYVGGFFSAMWQPESWRTTTITLATAWVVAKPASRIGPVIWDSQPSQRPPQPPTDYRHDTPPSRPKYNKDTGQYDPDHWHTRDWNWSEEKQQWFPGKWRPYGPDKPPGAPPDM